MRSKLIKADGQTVYAHAKDWEWNSSRLGRRATPVVVLRAGVTRKTGYPSWSRVTDGVEIQALTDDLKPDPTRKATYIVRAAEIRELWSTFKPAADETERLMRERHAARLAERRLLMDRLNTLFENVPAARRPWWAEDKIHLDGSYAEKGTMYLGELATLLDAVYAAGVNAGRREE